MLFFRLFQHLLPRSPAWSLTISKTLRKLFEGLAGVFGSARTYIDGVWGDLQPATTGLSELEEFERQFGLDPSPTESARRLALAAAWSAQGGQDPAYIQGVLQTAGFDVYVHEWWNSGPPFRTGDGYAKDPFDHTDLPLIGTYQCQEDFAEDQPQCSSHPTQPQCNAFLANDPKYIVNKDLTPRPPPPIPKGKKYRPFFIYIGAETFPDRASVPATRRAEFERLLLKLRPTQHWIVLLVDYVEGLATEDLEQILTEDGDPIAA